MTSLIWGAPYLVHKGVVHHRREKQRTKNYERWEGLRDDYDEQKRISRQSLDESQLRRPTAGELDRPILTLRDQQEANDGRTSWRPQERMSDDGGRPSSLNPGNGGRERLRKQKTGATWDEGLPEPLRVERRSFDERGTANEGRDTTAGIGSGSMARVMSGDSSKRSASLDVQRPRKVDDVEVVESPYNWWEQ